MSDIAERTELTLERRFKAPVDRVWEVVTQPETMVLWFGHDGWTMESHDLDFTRPGPWYAFMRSAEGNRFDVSGAVTEVSPPRHVAFTWAWHDALGARGHESRVSFTIAPAGDVTVFTLHHTGLPDAETASSHAGGWAAVLARLERQFTD
ncbi:SRPBCC domain-containing protein [Marinovum sp.]|uniref:SRPBCC family protein n=1 Tax=Marinovum sp. TaxID=2024839 RepID=UPI002B2649E6|nr:SRPBCC domain-containing protein [Marinovum sp.]